MPRDTAFFFAIGEKSGLAISVGLLERVQQSLLWLNPDRFTHRSANERDQGLQILVGHVTYKSPGKISAPGRHRSERHHEIGAPPVRQFDWNVTREWCRHGLHAHTQVAAPANRPADAVDRDGTIPEIRHTYRQMCFDGAAVASDDIPQPSVNMQSEFLSLSSQIESHDHGRKSPHAGDPGADCIPDLDLLIDRQVRVRGRTIDYSRPATSRPLELTEKNDTGD